MTRPPASLEGVEGAEDEHRAGHGNDLEHQVHDTPPAYRGSWLRLAVTLTLRAAFRPRLALDLLSVVWAFRARRWFTSPPFLPLPPREYIRWRMETAYGDPDAVPPADDVIRFARWRRKLLAL